MGEAGETDTVELEVPPMTGGGATASTTERGPPNLKIRKFHGDERKYLDWRSEILTQKKLYKITDETMAGLVYLALEPGEGRPRDLFRNEEVDDLMTATGWTNMLKVLDCCFGSPVCRDRKSTTPTSTLAPSSILQLAADFLPLGLR